MAFVKELVSCISLEASDEEARKWACGKIDQFIESRIVGAIEVITDNVLLFVAINREQI